ncbi:hypothetical protein LEP1GSC067_3934 [Leptospira interrogans serovar Lora str. TE 1992]|uniref:Uncharacterized protein n=2 Tax=Leptospira interrogans TaxID=173 RepID=M7AFP8_LEPIR|nr:hypothetical protein LEP1GSC067_3934 [Leptospira interrogans serovar Lora str. TE 1992]EMP09694.1 hypothetical protein LEP1GSC124_1666 [Leptospira interrogans serovar Pyrogenes str. 200701872]
MSLISVIFYKKIGCKTITNLGFYRLKHFRLCRSDSILKNLV